MLNDTECSPPDTSGRWSYNAFFQVLRGTVAPGVHSRAGSLAEVVAFVELAGPSSVAVPMRGRYCREALTVSAADQHTRLGHVLSRHLRLERRYHEAKPFSAER